MAAIRPSFPVSGPQRVSSSEPPKRETLQGILDHHFPKIADGKPIGCNLVVMRAGESADLLVGGDILPDAPQHWGSVSKQFTATCISELVNRGYLHFDDDIRTLCPDLPEFTYSDVVQIITVDQLLHMRSGLPDYRHFALMTGRDPERLGNKELLDLLVQHPEMMDKPGSRFVYSNTNYDLLAKIVETVAKAHHLIEPNQTFVDFVRDSVFLPYKMSARCSSDPTCLPTIDGFDAKRKQCASEKKQTLEFGSTGVVGRPSDMVHWNQALAGGELNSLLVPSQDIPLDRRENFYCRGLNMRYFEKYRRIAHGGQLDGYISIFRRYEHVTNSNMSFAFFLATNRGSDPRDVEKIADEIANVLAEKPIEHEDPPKVSEETKPVRGCQTEAQDFKGTYICDGFNSQWTVSAKEKEGSWEVHLSPTDQSVPGSLSEPIEFSPRLDQNGLFFQCPGVGRLERTVEGFDIIGERMPRVHFKKN